MNCPHCHHPLTDAEVRSLHAGLAARSRKSHRGGAPAKLSQADVVTIEAALSAGQTLNQIAEEYHVSTRTIRRRLARLAPR